MITINSLEISSDTTQLLIQPSTEVGETLVSIYAYKKYSNTPPIDLSNLIADMVHGTLTVSATSLGETNLSGIWYIEFNSDATENNQAIGIVANFASYHECLLNKALEIDVKGCEEVVYNGCPECEGNILLVSTFLPSLYTAIELGLYDEADDISESLSNMCVTCSTCPTYSETYTIPGYGFKTILNTIVKTS